MTPWDIVVFFQQELCQIAAVLAGHACDECFFIVGSNPFCLYLARYPADILS